MARRILTGVTVLDVTQIVAGPYATRMLADLGADVIRIEPPAVLAGEQRGRGGLNLGKRSIVLDLKKAEGIEIALKLAAHADVLVENYRPGALTRLGLGYDAVHAQNPRLVYATISGFGTDTSFGERPAYGATAHAEAGWLWVQQQAQGGAEPFAPGVTVADLVTGMNACMAVLAALFDRVTTGAGQFVNVTLMDSQLAFLGEVAGPLLAGEPFRPFRHGLQKTQDGYLTVNAGPPRSWQRLAGAVGDPGAAADGAEAVSKAVTGWAEGRSTATAATTLGEAGVAYGVMHTLDEALAHPYFAERGMVRELPLENPGGPRVVASPLRFSNAETGPWCRAPEPGEHTRAILEQFGFETDRIDALVHTGVVHQSASSEAQ